MFFLESFDKYSQPFIEWLNDKMMNKIGKLLGDGQNGIVYEYGTDKVIKLASLSEALPLEVILNKKIQNIATIYSVGEIKVPKRYKLAIKTHDDKIAYIIMEKIIINDELIDIIGELDDFIGALNIDIYENNMNEHFINIIHNSITPLHVLFQLKDNKEYMELVFNYKPIGYEDIHQIIPKIIGVFNNISKYFDWYDIHPYQFGYGKDGEIKAIDLGCLFPKRNLNKKRHLVEKTNH